MGAGRLVSWTFTLLTIISGIYSLCFPYYFGFEPIKTFFHLLFLYTGFVIGDFLVSDNPHYNREVLHLNGYSDFHLLSFFLITVFISFVGTYAPLFLFAREIDFHFDLPFFFWITFNLAVSEIFFNWKVKQ
mmetsp:Transcript_14482/g.20136  ORF Transcript_14482/g.20136 Transcript_14482/m.20136 type:complete len:131 (+) Transcript_14482:195-587(+)